MDRKDFFKNMGLGLGATLIAPINRTYGNISDAEKLSDEQKEFVNEYEAWLNEFQSFINKRNSDDTDVDNNKRLMELAAEAEKRKAKLEHYMQDENFAQYFNNISESVKNNIS